MAPIGGLSRSSKVGGNPFLTFEIEILEQLRVPQMAAELVRGPRLKNDIA
jgi:hypothetical protein